MGRSLLIIVGMTAALISTSLFGGAGTSATRSAEQVTEHNARVLAREIALSGHSTVQERVAAAFAHNGAYTGLPRYDGAFQGGTYSSDVSRQDSVVTIVTRSQFSGTSYVIRAEYAIRGLIPNPPPFMRAAMFSNMNFTINNRLRTSSEVTGVNANIRANNNITFNTPSLGSRVQGFGLAAGSVNMGPEPASLVFSPVLNPDRLPLTQRVSTVAFPAFSASAHASRANRTTPGDLTISGQVQLGTREAPVIWYVGGDFRTTGPVHFKGYGVFLVNGNVNFAHDVASDLHPAETSIAFYTDKNINQSVGVMNLAGQLFAGQNINIHSNATLYGAMSTAMNFDLRNAALHIAYRPVANGLTEPFWPGQSGVIRGADFTLALKDFREGG